MRYLNRFTSLVLLVTLLTFSCDNYSTSTSSSSKNTEKFSYVGKHHNKALDVVFQSLSDNREVLQSDDSRKSLKNLIQESISGYMEKNFESYKSTNVKLGIDIGSVDSYQSSNSTFSSNSRYNSVVKNSDLTTQQKELLEQVKKSLYTTSKITQLEEKLSQINITASDMLNEENARIIHIASSVGLNSRKYWKSNWSKWEELLTFSPAKANGENNLPEIKFDWGRVGANDVAGAVGGATAAAITGCAELTLGACAGVGAVAGGAGASATDAVLQLFGY